MTRRRTPVPPPSLAADHVTVTAIQGLADYQPTNPNCSAAQLLQLQANLIQAEQAEHAVKVALDQARAARNQAAHQYHDAVVSARIQVVAQYGADAAAVSLIGMTRTSERKRPAKRQAAAAR
jgi:hypothetical protein